MTEHFDCSVTYPDRACYEQVQIIKNEEIAKDTYLLRFRCPLMAQRITPGQFLMVRLADFDDPLLGRPFALYDMLRDENGNPAEIEIVYLVLGKMTSRLTQFKAGQKIEVWGPLGNGFEPKEIDHCIMVAGGIGQTPFKAFGREYLGEETYGDAPRKTFRAKNVTLCYGARNKEYLAGIDEFKATGMDVKVSTDDGSLGHHGFVTDLLRGTIENVPQGESIHVTCCGPEPMMEAVAKLTSEYQVPCEVSLETPMACGMGICFSCVAKIQTEDGEWDYRRTCVEGPVFPADMVVFD